MYVQGQVLENQLGGTVVEVLGGIRLRPNSFVNSEDDLEFELVRGNQDGNFKVELLKLDQQQQQRQQQLLRKQQQQLRQQQQQQHSTSYNQQNEVESRLHDNSITNQKQEYLQSRASSSNNETDVMHRNDDNNRNNNGNKNDNNIEINNNDNNNVVEDGSPAFDDVDEGLQLNDDDEVDEEDETKSPLLFQLVTTHPLDAETKSMYNLVLKVRHR